VSETNRVTASDQALDAEIEADLAAKEAERSLLELDSHTSYWAALNLRCALLTDISIDRAIRKELAALPLSLGEPPVLASRTAQLATCNRRLGWPYSTAKPGAIAQALDGAVMVIEHARKVDQGMPGWQRQMRWPVFALGLIYGAVRVGPRFLALLLLPVSVFLAGVALGALSGFARPLVGTSWLGRLIRGVIAGAVAGTLLGVPLSYALSQSVPGPPWLWLAAGAIMGVIYGPLYQPRDDPYCHDSE
jgi:hypothetical protein